MNLYGLDWPQEDPIEIEVECIRLGGTWKMPSGKVFGKGLFHHYKQLQTHLWPWKRWDRWSELLLSNFVKNRLTVVTGPANSTKTHSAASYALCKYIAFPSCTSVLISSTDSRSLELRIWGEIKKLWDEARRAFDGTPGRMIESRQLLVTDVEDREATDVRNGCIGIPCLVGGSFVGIGKYCFPAGTPVDTPNGTMPIENIGIGDYVRSAIGWRKVYKLYRSRTPSLVRIKLSDGRSIVCTPDHPFLTEHGWIKAVDLSSESHLCPANATMSILREGFREKNNQTKILLRTMRGKRKNRRCSLRNLPKADTEHASPRFDVLLKRVQTGNATSKLQRLRHFIHSKRQSEYFLYALLRSEMEDEATGNCEENGCKQELGRTWQKNQRDSLSKPGVYRAKAPIREDTAGKSFRRQVESWLWDHKNRTGKEISQVFSGCYLQLQDQNGPEFKTSQQSILPYRFRLATSEASRGNRRLLSQESESEIKGCNQGRILDWIRVESVEILKQTDFERFSQGGRTCQVYNLGVEGHPSYSVNGVIAHNCGVKNENILLVADELQFMNVSFYDSIANLNKNVGFQCIGLGNPKDRTDTLGKLAEPASEIGGWEGHESTGKTRIWPTRFTGGIGISLDGRDSPNNETPEGQKPLFPYIIKRTDIEHDLKFYGEDSIQVAMMDYGVFPRDAQARRVITRTLCERFRAMEEPFWSHEPLKKLFGIDAAYGAVGGDRCIGVEMHFGRCTDGKTRLAFATAPIVIPVSAKSHLLPEDQIALYVKQYCEDRQISPSCVGFDSTGRGSLVSAFGRIWSTAVLAIEFGGHASDRPVSAKDDLPCRAKYCNFMSELWYQFRNVIESDQMRALPTDVMEEMCMRGWTTEKGNKIKVEPKDECKLRMGRSPDTGDASVVGLEIARRIGFSIAGISTASRSKSNWLQEIALKQQELRKSRQLTYSLR